MPEEATSAAARPVRDSTDQDRRLVERARQGDREALEELYLIHFDRIYSYLHMSVGNRHDAEDLTTQTFLKMLESIKSFRWQSEEEVPEPTGETESSAEAVALQSIGRQGMLELIEDLSQEQKQVLTLKFVFNLPNAEVATILEKTEGAIKSLQHRALVSLQKQISQKQE